MISRTSQLQRICLACRLGLAPRPGFPSRSRPGYVSSHRQRYSSDFSPQNKERIEALISGALDDIESESKKKHGPGHRGSRGGKHRRTASPDEPAEWELEPELQEKESLDSESNPAIIPEDSLESASVSELTSELNDQQQSQGRRLPARIFRHDLLNHQNLGVDALGKPVEALIIKNPNKMRSSKRQIPVLEEEMAATGMPLEWQSVLPNEETTEAAFSNEVMQNIEELRPKDTGILKRRDIDKLIDGLVDGFTREQLVTYVNRGKWDGAFQEDNSPSYSWVLKQSPWVAAQSNHWELLKPKQQQAVLILTGMWKLEVQEQIEGLGRTIVWIQQDVLQLIARPANRVLDALKADYLDKSNNERISVNFEESRLSIYARKATVSTVLLRLNEVVQNIRSSTISAKSVQAENLALPVLADLGRITKTAIRQHNSSTDLSVSWLAEDDVSNGQTEDPAHVVLRLLMGKQRGAQHQEMHIISGSKSSKLKDGIFVPYQRDKRSLAWRDRLRSWSRFVNPVSKLPSEPAGGTSALVEKLAKRPLLIEPDPESGAPGSSLETIATFGHILHTQTDAKESKMSSSRRVLTPVVPHPAALTPMTADIQSPNTQKSAITLNFAPDMAEPQSSDRLVPPNIELRLPINPFSDLSNFPFLEESVLEAVVSKQTSDFILPDESVDVRLTQKQRTPLSASQEPLQDFLRRSEFNLLEGRLRTPSRVNFSIPSALLSTNLGDASEQTETDVRYMFTGLEIIQTVSVNWRGHTLRYSTIEAGQHGGQRQELSLIANMDVSSPLTDGVSGKPDHSEYLQLVGEIASGTGLPWDKGHLLMNERSSEEFTIDMMDDSDATEQPSQDTLVKSIRNDNIESLTEENDDVSTAADGTEISPHNSEDTEIAKEQPFNGKDEKGS